MKLKKKNVVTAGLAVSLAAAMLIGGGTFAYLSDYAGNVVNEFTTNKVKIDIDETTGDQYDIIPGTSQDKDPSVTITATVPAYLYVGVYDGTDGLVVYDFADGWTLMEDVKGLEQSERIYYREVDADDDEQTFEILKNNKVYYDAALENSNMVDDEGKLKDNLKLTFYAYAIQQAGFTSAEDALVGTTAVSIKEELLTALNDGKAVTLSEDVTVSYEEIETALEKTGEVDINLNGKTLDVKTSGTKQVVVDANENLTITNGTLNFSDHTNPGSSSIAMEDGSTAYFKDVTMNMGQGSLFVDAGVNTATVTLDNCDLTSDGYYGISTNASDGDSGENVIIDVLNSTIDVTKRADSDSAAILFNIPGKLNITNSTLTGQRQGVIVRCGIAHIGNSTIKTTLPADNELATEYTSTSEVWGSGNNLAAAALVVGNYTPVKEIYDWNAECVIWDTTLTTTNTSIPQVVLAACNGHTTTFVTEEGDVNNMTIFELKDNDSNIKYDNIVG